MFLTATRQRNPGLVRVAVALHRAGELPPDTYLIDLDAVAANAAALAEQALVHDIELYFVTKQFGRNPDVIAVVARHIPKATAIDMPEAHVVRGAGARLGHIGHLVQVPCRAIDEVISWQPDAVTVFNLDKARAIANAAQRHGVSQPLLARVIASGDRIYPGQEGGVPLDAIEQFADEIARMSNVELAGVTSFPCLLYDDQTHRITPTPNLQTLLEARRRLDAAGHPVRWVNAPSATCVASIPLLAQAGVTHAEPGHALTGTTPLHAVDLEQPEIPAMVYLSEISHVLPDGRPAIFGGGFYARGRVGNVLLSRDPDGEVVELPVEPAPADAIDYYRLVSAPSHPSQVRVGDTAVLAFRTQIFVTRSNVAAITGLSTDAPRLTGLYGPLGRPL